MDGLPTEIHVGDEVPTRASTQQDLDCWLREYCLPESYTEWLATDALTAECAYSTVLNAVFGRGPRFRCWRDDSARPSTDDDYFSIDRNLEDSIYDPIGRRTFDWVTSQRKDKSNALTVDARVRAMNLLTTWLGQNNEDGPTPSLSKLCAQKTAMGMFKDVRRKLCDKQAVYDRGKLGVVKAHVESTLSRDFPHQNLVLDELLIFLIVYELFVDLRLHTEEPDDPKELWLPVWPRISKLKDDEEYNWWHHGEIALEGVVPWYGRGQLAKVTLLLHALTVSLTQANETKDSRTDPSSYGYVDLWKQTVDHIGCHPLALEGSLVQLKALAEFVDLDGDVAKYKVRVLTEDIVPALCRTLLDNGGERREGPILSEEERLRAWIIEETPREGNHRHTVQAHRLLLKAAKAPLGSVLDSKQCLAECIDLLVMFLRDKSADLYYCIEAKGIRRLRLSGDHSKEDLYRAILTAHKSLEVLNLENCDNVDEATLDILTGCCKQLHVLLLFGTNVPHDCRVVKRLKKKGCFVHFGPYGCRSCAQKRRIETLATNVYSISHPSHKNPSHKKHCRRRSLP